MALKRPVLELTIMSKQDRNGLTSFIGHILAQGIFSTLAAMLSSSERDEGGGGGEINVT